MKRLFISLISLAVLAGCLNGSDLRPPPPERFYWPSGVTWVPNGGAQGTLFVVNANFDKRFNTGSISALDVATAGLPAFGEVPDGGPRAIETLPSMPAALISSFGGELAALKTGASTWRLYVPSRSEGMRFQAVDADFTSGAVKFSCATPVGQSSEDCGTNAPSLSPTTKERDTNGLPRAPNPFGVAVQTTACTTASDCDSLKPSLSCVAGRCVRNDGFPEAQVLVTHMSQADSPPLSGTNTHGYLVQLDAQQPTVTDDNYLDLGAGATSGVAVGSRFSLVSGRYLYSSTNTVLTNLVRVIDRSNQVGQPSVQSSVAIADTRAIAFSSDETRAYLLGRSPDTLVVLSIHPGDSGTQVQVVRTVPMPQGPAELKVLPRAGRADLVAITCTGAGSLVFYDDDAGNVVAQVPGLGAQPFAIAADTSRAQGVRFFVSNFNDGRVAVVDVPDVNAPQSARVVARLGQPQVCLTKLNFPGCP